jgi:glycosyltransferase involved in cell wall biosynthesis
MAVGVPVLVAEHGGVREYVTDEVNGRVLPPDNPALWAKATVDLLEDEAAMGEMRRRNVRVAAQFTDERYARNMLNVYSRAAAAPS